MTRSTYVYVVQRGLVVVAAFTVKAELLSWLRGQAREMGGLHDLSATRVRDGGTKPELNTPLSIAGLLEGAE